ncbi:MAG: helix-turn-helix transcriptional regulator [Dysgonamonadaceae bacterium]|jgi:transcriptional regulator with XRE-family HTH domain|nr:helix-turn-helix transcriptional regulator [Dysgonamonadaceae bacterium]
MFSQRFIKIIEEKGISRYKISKDTKITEATLSNYCNGKVNPNPSIVKQLADYLSVDFNWLLTGTTSNVQDTPITADSTSSYRKRKKGFTKSNLKSILDHFETQIKVKDEIIKNNNIELRKQLSHIENKIDLLIQTQKK